AAQAPGDGIAQKSLIHRVLQGLARVAVSEMAQPPLARLIGPAGRRDSAIVRAVLEQQVHLVLVVGGRVLLVRDGETAHAARDRMVRIDDLDPKTLKRSMADVPAAYQFQITAGGRIESHRIVQVHETAPRMNESHDSLLLLVG